MDCIDGFYVGMLIVTGAVVGVLVFMLSILVLLLFVSLGVFASLLLPMIIWLGESEKFMAAAFIGSVVCLILTKGR